MIQRPGYNNDKPLDQQDYEFINCLWVDNHFRHVAEWINTIKNAKFVITDSFHGATFSLLYRHSFAVIDNRTGSARIATLLNTFNMSNPCWVARSLSSWEYFPSLFKPTS